MITLFLPLNFILLNSPWEFLGGLVVGILCFHCCGPGSIPGLGTKIPQAAQCSQKTQFSVLSQFPLL